MSKRFQDLEVYQLSEKLADEIWWIVNGWKPLEKDTIGKQIIRSADSIGANIAEGAGRGSYQDNRRFIKIARGSLYETQHWLRRAHKRNLLNLAQVKLLKQITKDLAPKLNPYLKSIGSSSSQKMNIHSRPDDE